MKPSERQRTSGVSPARASGTTGTSARERHAVDRRQLYKPALVAAVANVNEKPVKPEQLKARWRRQCETPQVTPSSIGDAVIVTDKVGRVTFMNPVAEELTGRSAAAALDRPLTEIFPIIDEANGDVLDPLARILSAGTGAT